MLGNVVDMEGNEIYFLSSLILTFRSPDRWSSLLVSLCCYRIISSFSSFPTHEPSEKTDLLEFEISPFEFSVFFSDITLVLLSGRVTGAGRGWWAHDYISVQRGAHCRGRVMRGRSSSAAHSDNVPRIGLTALNTLS
jgi:hypothetical protein